MEALAKDQSHVAVLTENSGPIGGRQTDIGMIPDGWYVQPLSQLLDFQNGFNAEKSSYGTGVPFANVLEVITQSHLTEADIPGRVSVNSNQLQAFLVRPGDILFNRTSETQDELGLASVYVGSAQIIFGGFVIRGRIRSNRLNTTFAGYLLRAPAVRRQIVARGQGAVRANIGQSELGSVMVPLPPAHEQAAIAEALGDISSLIAGLENLITTKRQIKQGAMQELLSGRRRLPGFETKTLGQTALGILPADWKVIQIGEIANVKTGPFGSSLHESDYVDDGTPIITVEHLGERCVLHHNLPRVSPNDLKRLAAYTLREGDIVFSRVGSIDRNARISDAEDGWLFSGRLLRLRAREDIDPRYLSYHFHSEPFKQRVRAVSVGQTMASLNTKLLESVLVAIPTYSEQVAIGSLLHDLDTELAALECRYSKACLLKQGMLQDLLTGRVRLI